MSSVSQMGVVAVGADDYRRRLVPIQKAWSEAVHTRHWAPRGVRLSDRLLILPTIDSAINEIKGSQQDYVLLVCGHDQAEVEDRLFTLKSRVQAIALGKPPLGRGLPCASASLFSGPGNCLWMMKATDAVPALKKAIIRQRTRQFATVRLIEESDLEGYFALRYMVWREKNYIPPDKHCPKAKLEIDFTDLFSEPLGLFIKEGEGGNETLVSCGRLVYAPRKRHDSRLAGAVKNFVELRKCECLSKNIDYPAGLQQSFDVLKSFPKFQRYYNRLVRSQLSKAELSRIIVHPEYRRQGLGEVIVDSLVDLAYVSGAEVLFLACVQEHEKFYGRCGFRKIPGLHCENFVNVRVPAIAMHRRLADARDGNGGG